MGNRASTGDLDETKVSRISAPTAPFVSGLYLTGIDCPLLVPLARIAHQEFKVFLPDIHAENFDLGTPLTEIYSNLLIVRIE